MPLTLVTPPAAEPLSLDDAKEHLRWTSSAESGRIIGYIQAARAEVERLSQRRLMKQTLAYKRRGFPPLIMLPTAPVKSIVSITYLDDVGNEQTLASSQYRADTDSEPAVIEREYGAVWPSTYPVGNSVTVTFIVGEEDPADIAPQLIQSMRLYVGAWFGNREAVTTKPLNELPGIMRAHDLAVSQRLYLTEGD